MKTIKLKLCDGLDETDLVFLPIIRKHYHVELTDTPDYVIYGPFGNDHLNYNCIKIFTTGECMTPNFNECDYATGFDYLDFGDRYLRLPLCSIMFRNGSNILDRAVERGRSLPPVKEKKFCSFVVSNGRGMASRTQMLEMLSAYKTVSSGGRYRNNVGGPVKDKLAFEHQHKFCITFENESYPGYTTEKLVDAFASGAVPIYFGDPRVGEMFNPKAFVNCHDFPDLAAAAEYVVQLDTDDALYAEMLAQPIFLIPPPGLGELEPFLCSIFDRDIQDAVRIPHNPNAYYFERRKESGKLYELCMIPYYAVRKIQRRKKKW